MHRTRRLIQRAALLAVAVVLTAAAAAPATAAASTSGGCRNGGKRVRTLSLVAVRSTFTCLLNRERARSGLRVVGRSTRLQRAANGHSHDMVVRRFFGHVTPAGGLLSQRVAQAGYLRGARRWSLGEALTFRSGRVTTYQLYRSLMRSPEHAAIVHDGRYRQVGVGLERGTPTGRRAGMTVTLNFGVVGRSG